ncbi:MAG: LysM peptidoglycan-binding domain-containing protein, partial [Lachnospiraceae bacterium]|nr:LysM peptidoglycan-binding domain-containing protein [Lachnospiraceae bacterium]
TVEVGGHTFRVSAYFDNTAVTQLSLKVADQTVIVYPEEKEFTSSENGQFSVLSLLPLTEKYLTVDLTAFTPAELTMVSVDTIFTGESEYTDTSSIAWTYTSDDDYTVNMAGDTIDLSSGTYYSSGKRLEMIVGDGNQLNPDNIRYIVNTKVTSSREWLVPEIYVQDEEGNRTSLSVIDDQSYYYDYSSTNRTEYIYVSNSELSSSSQLCYVSLAVNDEVFADVQYSDLKIFEGQFTNAQEAESAADITSQILCADMTQRDSGYPITRYAQKWITMVSYDGSGNVTGCLPFRIYLGTTSNSISMSLYERQDGTYTYVSYSNSSSYSQSTVKGESGNNIIIKNYTRTITTYSEYPADGIYYLRANYTKDGKTDNTYVTGAYLGEYTSIAEAVEAGADNIKDTLFNNNTGYAADYSQGVYFTIFIGEDGTEGQEIYIYCVITKQGTTSKSTYAGNSLRSGTAVQFTGLCDSDGNTIDAYLVGYDEDSFGEHNYRTIIVGQDVDLSNLAPMFYTSSGVNLYASGSDSPEVSGQNYHDFSNGFVQYTASAENGTDSANYWLCVVKATEGAGQLYINSLTDDSSETRVENGIIYSTREIMLDSYHDNLHDILLANMGTEAIDKLSAELESDVIELDEYWTLNGDFALEGYSTTATETSYGELPNLAKLRIRAKDGISDGTEIEGILTIKSGDNILAVLKLTGQIGDPVIVTEEIPQAVKYVPYGTMIQNNNKYSWNKTSYELWSGELPEGMVIKQNGELYGVPKETGEFTFTVKMSNSYSSFSSASRTYTLTVIENTDSNVDGATDTGYDLRQRIPDIDADSMSDSYLMISEGVYDEFVDIYLDGEKLVSGQDYTSESGSTRITIQSQTLASVGDGTHTLGIEFRTQSTDTLKRAAQNYDIGDIDDDSDDDSGIGDIDDDSDNDSGSGSGSGSLSVAVDSAETVAYTVTKGDTLSKIAIKFYGSASYWQKIYADNAELIKNPDKIYVGQVFTIRLLSKSTGTQQANTSAGTYTVAGGDNLWRIAQKVYGSSLQWRKIYYANQGTISNPGHIYAGQILTIPEN